ncbi:hypothetical protein TrCOL_g7704 [Triparma columacea]|uniref:U-box domain-containing protein n=1 Tax=Triparma columacea TaxID=722753 RepID=A0A9W7L1Z3_9STRA|nr:hypothetical protein TrCOL_g7704 [Triparma columacea]
MASPQAYYQTPTIVSLPPPVLDYADDTLLLEKHTSSITPPKELLCPITLSLFRNPVLAADGFTYERHFLNEWRRSNSSTPSHWRSPVTGETVSGGGGSASEVENKGIKGLCETWREGIDNQIRERASLNVIKERWTDADFVKRAYFLPLLEVGGGRGGGRCRDGNGVGYNLIVSGLVDAETVRRVASCSAEAFLEGEGGEGGKGCVEACEERGGEWKAVGEHISEVLDERKGREERRRERRVRDNEMWREQQDALRRRNGGRGGGGGGREGGEGMTWDGGVVGNMSPGVGYFPSLFALQSTAGISGAVVSGEDERRRWWIQTLLRIIAAVALIVFFAV